VANANLKKALTELGKTEGVRAVVLLSRDGFIIDSQVSERVDVEAIGAIISSSTGSSEVMGKNLGLGSFNQGMIEFGGGVVLLTLASDLILAVVADTAANLGALRYNVKKLSPEIVKNV
jgi:predicted regulator of Ras-like GTPase activity (Roadblock/LC7/MglB family)